MVYLVHGKSQYWNGWLGGTSPISGNLQIESTNIPHSLHNLHSHVLLWGGFMKMACLIPNSLLYLLLVLVQGSLRKRLVAGSNPGNFSGTTIDQTGALPLKIWYVHVQRINFATSIGCDWDIAYSWTKPYRIVACMSRHIPVYLPNRMVGSIPCFCL